MNEDVVQMLQGFRQVVVLSAERDAKYPKFDETQTIFYIVECCILPLTKLNSDDIFNWQTKFGTCTQ